MSQKPLSILISGAGIAGSSLALTLAKQPSFCLRPVITVIERSPVPRRTGQAVDIRGPAVDVIRHLKLEPAIKARHTTETGIAFMNGKGDIVAEIDATGDAAKQSATSEYEILRGELAGLLLDGVEDAKREGADVNIIYGETIASIDDGDDGVIVRFTQGKLETQRFDLVIAADGIGSPTRSMIFGEEDDEEHVKPSGMYLGFFTIPRVAEDDQLWHWCSLPGGLGMHLRPHREHKTMGVYLSITNSTKMREPELESVVQGDVSQQKAYLHEKFANVGWQSERFVAGLDAADDFYMTHWCQVVTPQWAKGRCVILGDAAFATMGVGTSLAMTGAYIVAGELAKVRSSSEVSSALQSYESIFRPWAAKHAKQPPGFPQLMNPQSTIGVTELHTILWLGATLRIPQLVQWLSSGDSSKGWTLPDYGW